MSEGRYGGRLPKPKDKTKVTLRIGDVSLAPAHDKAAEWAEEGESLMPHAVHPAAPESPLSKVGRAAGGAGADIGSAAAALAAYLGLTEDKP